MIFRRLGQATGVTLSLTSPRVEARLLEVVVLNFTVPSISHLLSCTEKTLFKTQQQNRPTPIPSTFSHYPQTTHPTTDI